MPSRAQITVSGLDVDVHFKDIRNLHVAVYPPDGRVRVAAPMRLNTEAVRVAVVKRLPWIKRQRAELQAAARQSERDMVSGETHYLWGRDYRLRVIETDGRPEIRINGEWLTMAVKPGALTAQRAEMLERFERRALSARIPGLIERWAPALGVRTPSFGLRRMKTKWGSYIVDSDRMWLNTELAKKDPRCLEYIVVHELCHGLERGHGEAFVALMDQHLPDWRSRHYELNNAPLSAETWPD